MFGKVLSSLFVLEVSGVNLGCCASRSTWEEMRELAVMFVETKGFSFLKHLGSANKVVSLILAENILRAIGKIV